MRHRLHSPPTLTGWVQRHRDKAGALEGWGGYRPLRSTHRPAGSEVPASRHPQLQSPLPLFYLSHLKGVPDPAERAVGHPPLCLLALPPSTPL